MNDKTQEQIGVVFIHGVGLRGSVWREAAEGLPYPCLLADFPLRDAPEEQRRGLSLQDYVEDLARQIENWEVRKFILVAHSISGVLAFELARRFRDRVVGLAAVGAIIPEGGGSFLSALPLPARWILPLLLRLSGTRPPEKLLRANLCSDLEPAQTDEIVRHFAAESRLLYTERIGAPVPDIPKLYVKLTKDLEVTPQLQDRMIQRFGRTHVFELASGHLPMISSPEGVRQAVERMMAIAADASRA
ncbi:alpha/beta fold hydrolase [Paenibacillus soyae]|uniref:Alpha/beta hydrolase n=1 Tax=Paenibacillus soyae TaxID=2969249 RepID=A0A9X2MVX8_9BACL|nr:alpha/beta hydrolase [Paenibacillus soyae]MCR2806883.1 alpha/beta hydrolase [Paenibacillus soyae]